MSSRSSWSRRRPSKYVNGRPAVERRPWVERLEDRILLACDAGGPLLHDPFDDGDLAVNDGAGAGWTAATFGGGGLESESAFRFDGRTRGIWNLFEISSVDTLDVWRDDATVATFQVGRAVVTGDGTDISTFGHADLRQQVGIVSAHEPRSGSGGGPDVNEANYFQNTGGGLFVEPHYQVEETGEVSVGAVVWAANKFKRPWSQNHGEFGIFTPVAVRFDDFDGRDVLDITIEVSRHGWTIEFSENYTPEHQFGEVQLQGRTISGGWDESALGTSPITTEFDDGAFLMAMGQNFANGRGQIDVLDVEVCRGQASQFSPDLAEPNDDRQEAFDLGDGDAALQQLTLHDGADQDWYQWNATGLGTVEVAIAEIAGATDLQLEITDAVGNTLATSDPNEDLPGAAIFVEPGKTYFFQIESASGGAGAYDLTVDQFAPYAIDPNLEPQIAALPGIGGGPDRPVTSLRTPAGDQDDFVANELIIEAADLVALEQLVSRYNGSIVATLPVPIPKPEWNLTLRDEIGDGNSYLVRVDLDRADASGFEAWMTSIEETDVTTFASLDALKLMAIAAKETLEGGWQLAPNLVGQAHSPNVVLSKTDEQNGLNGFGLGEVTWSNLQVARAWQYYDLLGLDRKIDLAIIDSSFAPLNADFPPALIVPMYDYVGEDYDVQGTTPFQKDKDWHGTLTSSAAAARLDNAFGSVGTGGQVAAPMLFNVDSSLFTLASAVRSAAKWGADVINMSLGWDCNFGCGFFALFSGAGATFSAVRDAANAGVVMFASAGNETWDLDQRLLLPAELPGVIGVGNVNPGNGRASSSSSYGSNVDMWAPGVGMTATPTPDSAPDNRQWNGTSASSPYLAGIAALMKAIDPTLNWASTQQILQLTANSSSDPRVSTGYVNAYEAVKATAARAGLAPLGDLYEPDDPGNPATPLPAGPVTRTIAPGDWDVFELTTTDYVDLRLEFEYFDEATQGNQLQAEFDGAGPIEQLGSFSRLGQDLLRPGTHRVHIWGTEYDSINAYQLSTASIQPSEIAPDRYDDQLPGGETPNNDFSSAAEIPSQIDASLLLATKRIDELNLHTETDRDFFTVQLPSAVAPGTGQSECLAAGDLRLSNPTTKQGSFELFVTPDAVRPFDINLYRSDGTPVTAFSSKSGLSYQLDCPHEQFPDGEITFSVDDPAGRNFYQVDLKYHRWDTLITPGWFLEFEQPPFRQHVPSLLENVSHLFPNDPAVIEDYFAGRSTVLPAEYAFFDWSEPGDYVLNVSSTEGTDVNVSLVGPDGQVVAEAQPRVFGAQNLLQQPGRNKRVVVADLPRGVYALKIQSDDFGVPYTLYQGVADAADFDDNGQVDGTDFLHWQRGFGSMDASQSDGDANGNQVVDQTDLRAWEATFAASTPTSTETRLQASALTRSHSFFEIPTRPARRTYEASLRAELVDVALARMHQEPRTGEMSVFRRLTLDWAAPDDKEREDAKDTSFEPVSLTNDERTLWSDWM